MPSDAGRVLVGQLVETLRRHDVAATGETTVHCNQAVASSIRRAATSFRADLVTMGTHARAGLLGLVKGSVSHDTAAVLDVPVLLLRQDARARLAGRFTIIAALDLTLSALAVLGATRRAAEPCRADVHLVHVMERGVTRAGYARSPSQTLQVMEAVAANFSQKGLRSQPAVLSGSGTVALQLARAAERLEADLLVVGSRRPTNLGRMLAGSVAYELARRSACPILLARRPLGLGSRIAATSTSSRSSSADLPAVR